MDIGYGDGTSPGGVNYTLMLVDSSKRYAWIYGMHGTSKEDIMSMLWRFFIDAGGFPKRIQCDFDLRFLGGKVTRLLASHGVHIRAAPPY